MKIKVIKAGIYGADGAVPIGTVFDIKGSKMPKGWEGLCQAVDDAPAEGATPLTNPASGDVRTKLLSLAATEIDEKDFLADGRPDVRALNDELRDDVQKFTAEERDSLWPLVAEEVKAARQA